MKKFALIIMIAGLFLAACGSQTTQSTDASAEQTYLIADIVSSPLEMEEQLVSFDGIIGHICRHSGDKMRVVQQDDEAYSILVMLGDFSSSLNPDYEGMEVHVSGIVKTSVRNLDALETHDHEGDAEGEHEHGDHECSSTAEAIALLKERGIDPDIVAYIELTAFEIK